MDARRQEEEGGSIARDYWYGGINRPLGAGSRIIKLNFSRISLSDGRQDADVLPISDRNERATNFARTSG